ncbi:hypothetical protein J4414_02275 [Candidatus Woesearchaeota archaeon]|nr:hypothetical protein [Candidatus Woesearchaeota archaeon]
MIGKLRKRLRENALAIAVSLGAVGLTGCHIGPNARGLNVTYFDNYKDTRGNVVVVYKNRRDLDKALNIVKGFGWLDKNVEIVKVENPEVYYKRINGDFDKLSKEMGFKIRDKDDPVVIHREFTENGERILGWYRP